MTSQAVLDAQPKSAPEAKIEPAAREARAEAPPKKARVEASPQDKRVTQPIDYQQNQFDRFSIKGY
jgi:hypothetical protein